MKLAVFSDIHEDVKNLELAFKKAEQLGCTEIICLGDIVGYSVPHYNYLITRNANKCIELIKNNCRYVVIGNHDLYAIRKLPLQKPFNDIPENWYQLNFDKRKELSENRIWLYEDNELSALLNDQSREWLWNLPEYLVFTVNDIKIFISHFLFPDITGLATDFMKYLTNYSIHYDFIKNHNAQFSFFGHIHTAKLLVFKEKKHEFILGTNINSAVNGIGIPAIARNKQFSGFAIYDTYEQHIELYKL